MRISPLLCTMPSLHCVISHLSSEPSWQTHGWANTSKWRTLSNSASMQGQCCVCSQFWDGSECSKDTLVKVSSCLLTELICLLMLFCACLNTKTNRQQSWDKLNVTITLFPPLSFHTWLQEGCRAINLQFAKVCFWEEFKDSEEAMQISDSDEISLTVMYLLTLLIAWVMYQHTHFYA